MRRSIDVAAAALATLVGAAVYAPYVFDLFPLAEFRDWVANPITPRAFADHAWHALARGDGSFTRDVSMAYVRTAGLACGPGITCLNVAVFAPVVVASALLFALARRLGVGPALACLAVGAWWWSAPVASALAWQATIHDRLALVFILASLLSVCRWVDAPLSRATLARSNLATGVAALLAYNSKEPGFVVGPLLVLAVALLRTGPAARVARGLALCAVPLAYGAFHGVRYFAFQLPENERWAGHVLGGSGGAGLVRMVRALLGASSDADSISVAGAALAAIALGGVLVALLDRREALRTRAAPLALALAGLAGSLAIASSTRFASLYYAYVPMAFFALAAAIALERIARAGAPIAARYAAPALLLVAIGFARGPLGLVREPAARARNFHAGLVALAQRIEPARLGELVFVRRAGPASHLILPERTRIENLWRHVVDAEALAQLGRGRVRTRDVQDVEEWIARARAPRELAAAFDAQLALVAIADGGRRSAPSTFAPPARAPNLLLIVVDTLRADHLGAYGGKFPTSPNLDRFARENLMFTRAVSAAPWTPPSIASLFTSQLPTSHRVERSASGKGTPGDALSLATTTLAEHLAAHGYETSAIVANPWLVASRGYAQGFATYLDDAALRARTGVDAPTATPALGAIAREEVARLSAQPRPFFHYLHVLDPHQPFDAPEELVDRFHPQGRERPRDGDALAKIRTDVAAYDAEISIVDAMLGALFAALREQGVYDELVVAFTSDHGEQFFEHGQIGHGHDLFAEEIHVPLLLKAPGLRGRIDDVVSTLDVAPTLVALAGLPPLPNAQGFALPRELEQRKRRGALVEAPMKRNVKAFVAGDGHKLVLEFTGAPTSVVSVSEERAVVGLYDWNADPDDRAPIIDDARTAALRTRLYAELARAANQRRNVDEPEPAALDAATIEALKAIGYGDVAEELPSSP